MPDKPGSNIERLEQWIRDQEELEDTVTQGQVQQSLWDILNREQGRLTELYNREVARQRTAGFATYIRRGLPFDRHRLFDQNLRRQGMERWTSQWTGKPLGIFRLARIPRGQPGAGRFVSGPRLVKPGWKGSGNDENVLDRILGK